MIYKYFIYLYIVCTGLLAFLKPEQAVAQEHDTPQSVEYVLMQTRKMSLPVEKVKALTSYAGKMRYTPETFPLIRQALQIAEENDDPAAKVHAYYSAGNYYYFASEMDSSLLYLNKAEKWSEMLPDPLIKAMILITQSGVYKKTGDVSNAVFLSLKANKLLDDIDTTRLDEKDYIKVKGQRLTLLNSLGNLYNQLEDYYQAMNYYEEALAEAEDLKNYANMAVILENKGDLLIKMKRPGEAVAIIKQALRIKRKENMPLRFIGTSHLNLGIALAEIEQNDASEKHLDSAYGIFHQTRFARGIMQTLTHRGKLFNKLNLYEKSLHESRKAQAMALEMNDWEYLSISSKALYEAYKNLGRHDKALTYHEKYMAYRDSVFNDKNVRKISRMEMQFSFDKEKARQAVLMEKRKNQRNQLLAGSSVLVIMLLGSFVFFRKRIKYQKTIASQQLSLQKQKIIELQQKNKLIALQGMIEGQEAERLRIAKDLHDGLGGLLSSVKAHYSRVKEKHQSLKTSPEAKKTEHLIEEAYAEVRRVSHNMMPHALNLSGLTGAIDDLCIQLRQQNYQVTFESHKINEEKISPTKKIILYRIVQEAVTNIRKHAEARNILIQLIGNDNELSLIIEDDGIGFDYDEAVKLKGAGIQNINSRVAFLDGTIHWHSRPGKGTNITVNIPL